MSSAKGDKIVVVVPKRNRPKEYRRPGARRQTTLRSFQIVRDWNTPEKAAKLSKEKNSNQKVPGSGRSQSSSKERRARSPLVTSKVLIASPSPKARLSYHAQESQPQRESQKSSRDTIPSPESSQQDASPQVTSSSQSPLFRSRKRPSLLPAETPEKLPRQRNENAPPSSADDDVSSNTSGRGRRDEMQRGRTGIHNEKKQNSPHTGLPANEKGSSTSVIRGKDPQRIEDVIPEDVGSESSPLTGPSEVEYVVKGNTSSRNLSTSQRKDEDSSSQRSVIRAGEKTSSDKISVSHARQTNSSKNSNNMKTSGLRKGKSTLDKTYASSDELGDTQHGGKSALSSRSKKKDNWSKKLGTLAKRLGGMSPLDRQSFINKASLMDLAEKLNSQAANQNTSLEERVEVATEKSHLTPSKAKRKNENVNETKIRKKKMKVKSPSQTGASSVAPKASKQAEGFSTQVSLQRATRLSSSASASEGHHLGINDGTPNYSAKKLQAMLNRLGGMTPVEHSLSILAESRDGNTASPKLSITTPKALSLSILSDTGNKIKDSKARKKDSKQTASRKGAKGTATKKGSNRSSESKDSEMKETNSEDLLSRTPDTYQSESFTVASTARTTQQKGTRQKKLKDAPEGGTQPVSRGTKRSSGVPEGGTQPVSRGTKRFSGVPEGGTQPVSRGTKRSSGVPEGGTQPVSRGTKRSSGVPEGGTQPVSRGTKRSSVADIEGGDKEPEVSAKKKKKKKNQMPKSKVDKDVDEDDVVAVEAAKYALWVGDGNTRRSIEMIDLDVALSVFQQEAGKVRDRFETRQQRAAFKNASDKMEANLTELIEMAQHHRSLNASQRRIKSSINKKREQLLILQQENSSLNIRLLEIKNARRRKEDAASRKKTMSDFFASLQELYTNSEKKHARGLKLP